MALPTILPSYIRVHAVVWEYDEGQTQTHRQRWPIYILARLCLTRSVIKISVLLKAFPFSTVIMGNRRGIWPEKLVPQILYVRFWKTGLIQSKSEKLGQLDETKSTPVVVIGMKTKSNSNWGSQ